MLLSDSKYLPIFLIRIHLKGLRWHFKSLMKCYCQQFNCQCSCKTKEPSWKLNDLFFTCFEHQQFPYQSPQSFEMHLNYSQRQRKMEYLGCYGIWWPVPTVIEKHLSETQSGMSMFCDIMLRTFPEQGEHTSGSKGNETQTSCTYADAAAIEKLH